MRRPRIAITLGDPRGIGPEVAVRAMTEPRPLNAELTLIGPEGVIDPDARQWLLPVGTWDDGSGDVDAGRVAVRAVERAVELALAGDVDGIVTAPIHKPSVPAAGYAWPGHTEMLRDLVDVPATALCMVAETDAVADPLRVALVTGHIALRDVPDAYTVDRLQTVAQLTDSGLRRWWGIDRPRLAVCGLNPHASDRGMFGDEEARVCEPAMTRLREQGIEVEGPYPADTVFLRALRGEADAVLAPYHDLGMAVIKTVAFTGAVNVTLGLPFPRTSPDHGTAFDIAGSGRARATSMRAALELAVSMAVKAFDAERHPG